MDCEAATDHCNLDPAVSLNTQVWSFSSMPPSPIIDAVYNEYDLNGSLVKILSKQPSVKSYVPFYNNLKQNKPHYCLSDFLIE